MDDVLFFVPCGHGRTHASKGGKRTLCGIEITDIWAAVSEADFKRDRPCHDCRRELRRILRKGRQLPIW